jgi:hypothetical protein
MNNIQQQLFERNTYTPTDASQVCSPVVLSLNRDESLSEQDLKTSDNNLDVNQRQHIVAQKLSGIVYVLSKEGKVLMPTTSPKARKLLRQNKAKVVNRKPFRIQLLVECREEIQEVVCKIDSGAKVIGFSCITNKKELICGELKLENKTKERILERKMYRRQKRNKLWYRQARFLNRKKESTWLPPSIERNYQTHLNLIKKLEKLVPISKKIIEVGNFNIQKFDNPNINGVEYQQGKTLGYDNVRAYVFARDNYTCQICKKDKGILETHHIIFRSNGGTDKPDNLVTLHLHCHMKFHSGEIKHKFSKPKEYKESTFMNIIKNRFQKDIDCDLSYGYITKRNRLNLGLEKTHYNDAFCIENNNSEIIRCNSIYMKQKRHNNRSLQVNRNGFKPSIRRQRYNIQPHDLVWVGGKEYVTKGIHSYGNQILLCNKKSISTKLIKKHYSVGGLYV